MTKERRTGLTRRELFRGAAAGLAAATIPGARAAAPARPGVPYRFLSEPLEALLPSYDFAVIGSGYGGSILAARLAEKGWSVSVLERGQEWPPGSFPEGLGDVVRATRAPWNPKGLYDFVRLGKMTFVVGSGLGGTSLINANVAFEPDPSIFDSPYWPEEIRRERDGGRLKRHFDTARAMLGVERIPENALPPKAELLRNLAEPRGARHLYPELAINFTRYDQEPNAEGAWQAPCSHCGNCIAGCNVGAKNTLNFNYLRRAKAHGASLFTGAEVELLRKLPAGGYEIVFKRGCRAPEGGLVASNVVISAGVLGSSELLLRSRAAGALSLSERLGERVSGNGDFVGFAYNGDAPSHFLGHRPASGRPTLPAGPMIASAADYRDTSGFVIEEGALPIAVVRAFRVALALSGLSRGRAQRRRALRDLVDRKERNDGALNHSLFFLGMGHDDSGGRLTLDAHGQLGFEWSTLSSLPVLRKLREEMTAYAARLAARNVKLVREGSGATVHPLGGCPMGDGPDGGVVDHLGRVFDPSSGGLHEGLFVADGSIIPASVGVNPMLTISALTERIAEAISPR